MAHYYFENFAASAGLNTEDIHSGGKVFYREAVACLGELAAHHGAALHVEESHCGCYLAVAVRNIDMEFARYRVGVNGGLHLICLDSLYAILNGAEVKHLS